MTEAMEKLISVIVPIYKVEEYLPRCVDSILNQSYRNIEVILVDDGSPDRCGDICEQYKLKDQRVVVIHKKNGGLSDARNAGTDVAKGELITYVDSDDWIHREFLQILYRHLSETDADIAICSNISTPHFIEDQPVEAARHSVYDKQDLNKLLWANVDQRNRLHRDMIVAWGKLYKRELIGAIRYPYGRIHEDNFVTHQLLFAAHKVVYLPLPLVFYFQRNDSITAGTNFSIRKRLDMIDSYAERASFFNDKGHKDLADFCRRMQFMKSFSIDHHLESFPDQARVQTFKKQRQGLRQLLRLGKYNPSFRVFYEAYYLAPKPFVMLHQKIHG